MLIKARCCDADEIMSLIMSGQLRLKEKGVDQWQNGYPTIDIIKNDIETGTGYVLIAEEAIAAYAVLQTTAEPTYARIDGGAWLSQQAYATIHRLCVRESFAGRGIGAKIVLELCDLARKRGYISVRVDTHRDNAAMQTILTSTGFIRCGTVYMGDGSERVAFERLL